MVAITWFRDDLRLADHAALSAAAKDPDGIVALYVLDDETAEVRPLGSAARWWLHESLQQLERSLATYSIPLILRRGPAEQVLPEVVSEVGATAVHWNRRYGAARALDARLKESLTARGITAHSYPGNLLFEPWTVANSSGDPYAVYSAFWRACLRSPEPDHPLPIPTTLIPGGQQPYSEDLTAWNLQPANPRWWNGFHDRWVPGEATALEKLTHFLDSAVTRYHEERDFPARSATSELSPHLRFGEISPRTIWHISRAANQEVEVFLSELGWREFAWHTTYAFPDLHQRSLNQKYQDFPWRKGAGDEVQAWQQGNTGYGIVDAGMRELWQTGFMHNRVRMVAASFLTKNLLVDWRVGEEWFWDTLVDADEASNPFNWQWVAGCGRDASPYFRIFNPQTQQKKFDHDGLYVNYWAPESANLEPVVDLSHSRGEALAAYESIRH